MTLRTTTISTQVIMTPLTYSTNQRFHMMMMMMTTIIFLYFYFPLIYSPRYFQLPCIYICICDCNVYVIVFLTDSLTMIFPAAGPDFLNPTSSQADANGISILIIPLLVLPYFHTPIISISFIFCFFQLHPSFGFSPSLAGQNFLPNLPRVRGQF